MQALQTLIEAISQNQGNQNNQPESMAAILATLNNALGNHAAGPATLIPAPAPKIFQSLKDMQHEISESGIAKSLSATDKSGKELYKARGIDSVYNLLSPLFSKFNIVVGVNCIAKEREAVQMQYKIQYQTFVTVEYSFISALDGSKHSVTVYGEAFDHGDKGIAKALSMAFKYACFQVFCIPVCDDPDSTVHEAVKSDQYNRLNIQNQKINGQGWNGNNQQQGQSNNMPYITSQQIETLIKTVEQAGFKPYKVLERYNVQNFNQLTQAQFIELIDNFKQYAQNRNQTGQQNHANQGNYS